jgi:hypothetical protein
MRAPGRARRAARAGTAHLKRRARPNAEPREPAAREPVERGEYAVPVERAKLARERGAQELRVRCAQPANKLRPARPAQRGRRTHAGARTSRARSWRASPACGGARDARPRVHDGARTGACGGARARARGGARAHGRGGDRAPAPRAGRGGRTREVAARGWRRARVGAAGARECRAPPARGPGARQCVSIASSSAVIETRRRSTASCARGSAGPAAAT